MKNIINTLIITLIINLIAGFIINSTLIAPVAQEAAIGSTEAARPIKINAKKAISLKAEIAKIVADQKGIDRSFAEAMNDQNFEFKINNKLTLYKHKIKVDLNEIKSMINNYKYDQAETEINNYKILLKDQVRDCYGWMPMARMLKCLYAADRNGVYDYFVK